MGITALTFSVSKTLKPGQSQKVIGVLTLSYGVGQILGHLVSGIYGPECFFYSAYLHT